MPEITAADIDGLTSLKSSLQAPMQCQGNGWAEYEAGLRCCGGLTLWMTPEVLEGWAASRCQSSGCQSRYSDLAIETTLMLGMVLGLRLRARSFLAQQTEAAIGVTILNRMLACGRPKSVRFQTSARATK